MEEQIKEYLMSQFIIVYCDTCNSEYCEDCYRKNMNWGISEEYASCLTDRIMNIVKSNNQ